jgi:hypothetical protein
MNEQWLTYRLEGKSYVHSNPAPESVSKEWAGPKSPFQGAHRTLKTEKVHTYNPRYLGGLVSGHTRQKASETPSQPISQVR